ncbi:MAG: alpha/beta hydrolase [bacterium]
MRKTLTFTGTCALLLGSGLEAQGGPDKSPHQARFVSVADDVRLEVLDWGGSGRPLVLLAGLGDNAHVFDAFAPKLSANYHVYGITRRGFGLSSSPPFGYGADRLGDDVLAVIDSLGLRLPILAGHSMGGEELSSIGSRHADKVAALIYLEAGYDYAFYDQSHGNLAIDINEMERQLDKLRFGSGTSAQERRSAMHTLADTTLPGFAKWLHVVLKEEVEPGGPPSRPMARVPYAIIGGEQKYTAIHGPVLAIWASPSEAPPGATRDQLTRAMIAEADSAAELQANAFARGVPQARVVRIPHADHYVFRSREAEVLREMRAFIDGLPNAPK